MSDFVRAYDVRGRPNYIWEHVSSRSFRELHMKALTAMNITDFCVAIICFCSDVKTRIMLYK